MAFDVHLKSKLAIRAYLGAVCLEKDKEESRRDDHSEWRLISIWKKYRLLYLGKLVVLVSLHLLCNKCIEADYWFSGFGCASDGGKLDGRSMVVRSIIVNASFRISMSRIRR